MELDKILLLLGSFISLLLMVNAYFTREVLLRVVRLEIKMEANNTKHFYVEKQVDENTHEIKKLRDFKHKHQNDGLHLLQLLEEFRSETKNNPKG